MRIAHYVLDVAVVGTLRGVCHAVPAVPVTLVVVGDGQRYVGVAGLPPAAAPPEPEVAGTGMRASALVRWGVVLAGRMLHRAAELGLGSQLQRLLALLPPGATLAVRGSAGEADSAVLAGGVGLPLASGVNCVGAYTAPAPHAAAAGGAPPGAGQAPGPLLVAVTHDTDTLLHFAASVAAGGARDVHLLLRHYEAPAGFTGRLLRVSPTLIRLLPPPSPRPPIVHPAGAVAAVAFAVLGFGSDTSTNIPGVGPSRAAAALRASLAATPALGAVPGGGTVRGAMWALVTDAVERLPPPLRAAAQLPQHQAGLRDRLERACNGVRPVLRPGGGVGWGPVVPVGGGAPPTEWPPGSAYRTQYLAFNGQGPPDAALAALTGGAGPWPAVPDDTVIAAANGEPAPPAGGGWWWWWRPVADNVWVFKSCPVPADARVGGTPDPDGGATPSEEGGGGAPPAGGGGATGAVGAPLPPPRAGDRRPAGPRHPRSGVRGVRRCGGPTGGAPQRAAA